MRSLFLPLWLPACLLGLSTLLIHLGDFDMRLQRALYDPARGWQYAQVPLLEWVYGAGVVPGFFLGLSALVLLLAGIGRPQLARYRKICALLVGTLAIGSGLITNALLKGLWGRPRPSQIDEFGGAFRFEPVGLIDLTSFGKSFPCGHATMGFFFFALALCVPPHLRFWRFVAVSFALVLGGLLGLARMAQGGHFFSDVIWAAAIMWFTAYGLYLLLGMEKGVLWQPQRPFQKILHPATSLVFAPIVIIALFVVLIASPYSENSALELDLPPGAKPQRIVIDIEGELELLTGQELAIHVQSEGFGTPRSGLRLRQRYDAHNATLTISSFRKGFFAELRARTKLTIPDVTEPLAIVPSRRVARAKLPQAKVFEEVQADLPLPLEH